MFKLNVAALMSTYFNTTANDYPYSAHKKGYMRENISNNIVCNLLKPLFKV